MSAGEEAASGGELRRRDRRAAFAVLQDKFAHARRLACCPAMDLVALLTVDGQLLVHRAVSWQRLLHVKPSDVSFAAEALEWRPDGRALALGCAEGEVVVFDVETGAPRPELRALRALHTPHHSCAVTSMHWAQCGRPDSSHRSHFRDRAGRLLDAAPSPVLGTTSDTSTTSATSRSVLATADASGHVVLWWAGTICVATIDVGQLFRQSVGATAAATVATVERVHLAPDLSRLFAVLAVRADSEDADDDDVAAAPRRELVALDLGAVRAFQDDLGFVARTVDAGHRTLHQLVLARRQMVAEWKAATRIFELKLGLLGALYEKYACADPPQVHMLATLASGITSPALAQFFAQDIQETSVDRMRQLLVSGCQTLATLVNDSLKAGLVRMLFHVSELRGRAKWKRAAFEYTLGITVAQLDELATLVEELLVGAELLAQAVQETRQDFLLLFQWIVERIRVHTNTPSGGRGGASVSDRQGGAAKSLLNQRRLSHFLQRAAHAAHQFRDAQPPHSRFRVETTFGNLVSKQLATPTTRAQMAAMGDSGDPDAPPAAPSLAHLLDDLESKWFALVDGLSASVAATVAVDPTGCFSLGDAVEEYSFHCRDESEGDAQRDDGCGAESDDTEEEDDDEMDAVDWGSLASFALGTVTSASTRSVLMLGVRLRSAELLLLRATWSRDTRDELGERLAWEAVKLAPSASDETRASDAPGVELQGFAFYGDKASGKQEQLAFLLGELHQQDGALERHAWLYFQHYDNLAFAPLKIETGSEATTMLRRLHELPALALPTGDAYRARQVATAPAAATTAVIPRVVANAKRGIDDDDDDYNDDDTQNTNDDAQHKGHESDSIEVDL
ncbi:hypothetical protein PybrP1_004570 [[Pythium] brassicae (nom. inval.)]|nr:hypothetical protein PybrP1_004570 [[Pythium] brassicae (nom. inval.)]